MMNRLEGMRTYLAGAMDRVPDGGVVWRDKITPLLESKGVVVLNPCDKPVEVGIEDASTRASIEELKEKGEYGRIKKDYGVIRTLDLRCVDISDFIIFSFFYHIIKRKFKTKIEKIIKIPFHISVI